VPAQKVKKKTLHHPTVNKKLGAKTIIVLQPAIPNLKTLEETIKT